MLDRGRETRGRAHTQAKRLSEELLASATDPEVLLGTSPHPIGWTRMTLPQKYDWIATRYIMEARAGVTSHLELAETGILSPDQLKRRMSREVHYDPVLFLDMENGEVAGGQRHRRVGLSNPDGDDTSRARLRPRFASANGAQREMGLLNFTELSGRARKPAILQGAPEEAPPSARPIGGVRPKPASVLRAAGGRRYDARPGIGTPTGAPGERTKGRGMATIHAAKTVDDLYRLRADDESDFKVVGANDVEFGGDSVTVEGERLHLGEDGMRAIAAFLSFPLGGLEKLSVGIRAEALEWLMEPLVEDEKQISIESRGGAMVGVWNADRDMIPRARVIETIAKVLPGSAEVRSVEVGGGAMAVDISAGSVTVEPRVGDVTEGGLRFYAHIQPGTGRKQQPRVSSFWYRLMCSNGMTRKEERARIRLHSNTVDGIIEEMEGAARMVWGDIVPERVEQYAHLAEVPIPRDDRGDMATYLVRIGRENGIPIKIVEDAVSKVSQMEGETLYDLLNLVSGYQNAQGVQGAPRARLQELAGTMVTDHAVRCTKCLTRLQ